MPRLQKDQFESLVREHHTAVYRSAFRLLPEPADAADVAQDVFVRVLEGKVRLAAAHSVRATLCWLATRLASNARRAHRRRSHHEEKAMNDHDTITPQGNDPARLAADRDLRRSALALVAALPRDLQVPLQMRCQDGLTFAAIGSALRLPESTVHDRVQQALQQLRTALLGRGFAVALAGLPDIVAAADATVAPVDLQARLLALPEHAAAGAFGAGKLALGLGAAAIVTGLAVFAASLATPGERAPTMAAAATVVGSDAAPRERLVGQDPPVASTAGERTLASVGALVQENPASPPVSIFHGTVHDAAAWPVAGAEVHAVAAGGLKPFQLGRTTTDQQGAFRLTVDPRDLWPSRIRLRVVETGNLLLETEEYTLPRAVTEPPLTLVLAPGIGTAMTRYELHVSVRSDDGVPLASVPIQLVPDVQPTPRFGAVAPEAEGTTGADGLVVLSGRNLGAKRVMVDGRPLGRRSHAATVVVDRAGVHRAAVSLAAGRTLQGRIGTVDGTPVPWANVWLEDDATGQLHTTQLAGDGAVAFTGLGDGTYTLHVSSVWELSPYERRGMRALATPFEVRLKQRNDLRDVGDHMAELHGELVDGETGAVVPFTGFQVDVLPWRDGDSTLPADRLVPRGPVQQMESGTEQTGFCQVALPPGRWALVVTVPGYAATVAEFDLREGEMRTGLRVPLQRGAEVHGRVLQPDGARAARTHVFLVGTGALADEIVAQWRASVGGADERQPDPSHLTESAWTAADGTFALRDVPPGVALRLVASHTGRGFAVMSLPIVASGQRTEGLVVQLGRP